MLLDVLVETMENIVAFHSYKGGTGKTTLASNSAAVLATEGYRVGLLDLDVYAPSLQSYFQIKPSNWINDFLYSSTDLNEIMVDITHILWERNTDNYGSKNIPPRHSLDRKKESNMEEKNNKGKLWVGFCSNKKEHIQKLEAGANEVKKEMFRNLVLLREKLTSNYSLDYLIIDTSPGMRYWSINALAIADIFLLTLKMGDLDIDGTKVMVNEIYSNFTKEGSQSFLLCNRVAGYCMPRSPSPFSYNEGNFVEEERVENKDHSDYDSELEHSDFFDTLEDDMEMKVISAIPCYCDIQFSKKEFLTVLKYPEHPFAKQIQQFVKAVQNIA